MRSTSYILTIQYMRMDGLVKPVLPAPSRQGRGRVPERGVAAMEIEVKYTGPLSKKTGKSDERISLEAGTSFGELLLLLETRYGSDFARLRTPMLTVVNGRTETAGYVLRQGDKVSFLRPVLGG